MNSHYFFACGTAKLNFLFAMGKAATLSDFEKGKISAMRDKKHSIREIAQYIKRSKSAVGYYLKSLSRPNTNPKKRGPKFKVVGRLLRRVLRVHSSNPSRTSTSIMNAVDAKVSKATAVRTLKRAKMRYLKKKSRPSWKPHHRSSRLQFAKEYQTWDKSWRRVIFSDEKKFNSDGPDGFHSYWHAMGNEFEHFSKRQNGGPSFMVWGAVGYGGKFPLMECPKKMNAERYVDMLERTDFVDTAMVVGGETFIFQQDNAPVHKVIL